MTTRILTGDCRTVIEQALSPASIDAVICDPPYELGFMGKTWDRSGVAFDPSTWAAVMVAMKPGSHLLAFGGTRTYHRIAVAIEDAGFEIRDCLSWLYGSGFPKSHDIGKAIDRLAGAEREVIGTRVGQPGYSLAPHKGRDVYAGDWSDPEKECAVTSPATPEAEQWDGWGTALKPGWEPIILARKPFKGTVATNVLEHGTGALNVDGCRIGSPEGKRSAGTRRYNPGLMAGREPGDRGGCLQTAPHDGLGRWPANVVLDETAAAMLDQQSGESVSRIGTPRGSAMPGAGWGMTATGAEYDDQGGASRFFYTAKASRSERNGGLEGMPERKPHHDEPNGRAWDIPGSHSTARANHHPTVKPVSLMRWLCRLVTPPDGIILDPFTGSGSTGVAAVMEGFQFVGIEQDPEYVEIAQRRIAWAEAQGRQIRLEGVA